MLIHSLLFCYCGRPIVVGPMHRCRVMMSRLRMVETICPEQVTFYPGSGLKVTSWVSHLQVSYDKIHVDCFKIMITM